MGQEMGGRLCWRNIHPEGGTWNTKRGIWDAAYGKRSTNWHGVRKQIGAGTDGLVGEFSGLMDIWFFNGWQEEFLREPRKGCDSQAARLRKEDLKSCMTG